MEITEMTNEQLEARSSEIIAEMEKPDADLEELRAEAQRIRDEKELRAEAAQKAETRKAVAQGEGTTIRNIKEEHEMPEVRTYNASSPEYRRAWLKDLAVCDNKHLFGEMNEEERAAFTHTTANSGSVVPTDTLNMIIELVDAQSPMYNDAYVTNFVHGFEIPRHLTIAAGDAKGTAEGTANDDEKNTFDVLPMSGIEIRKHVVISRKMQFQSIDAFEKWVAREIADRIAVAKEKIIIARLDGTAPDGGSIVAGAKIDTGNVLTAQTYTDATILSIMGKIHGAGQRVVYANNATIWGHIAGMEDTAGNKLFIPSSMEDPLAVGRIYGAVVKQNEHLADNVAYFGIKGAVKANDFVDTEILPSMDGKTGNNIVLGYSLFDAGLGDPKSFVKATFTTTGG